MMASSSHMVTRFRMRNRLDRYRFLSLLGNLVTFLTIHHVQALTLFYQPWRQTQFNSQRRCITSHKNLDHISFSTALYDKSQVLDSYDVIVVGSGIGGLSCAAMLSLYNYSVAVFEAHSAPGGCAHGFQVKAPSRSIHTSSSSLDPSGGYFHFDTGPSFFSGIGSYSHHNQQKHKQTSNPLKSILDAIGEKVDCIPYNTFGLCFPEGNFIHSPQTFATTGGILDQVAATSSTTVHEPPSKRWNHLMNIMEPLSNTVASLPTAALRSDIGVLATLAPYMQKFLQTTRNPFDNLKLSKPFSYILDEAGLNTKDYNFARNWLDLLCFCLSGLPASGTITAEMAMMMGEFYEDGAVMDCPRGGAKAIVDALVRGITKRGGVIFTNALVKKIHISNGQAVGVSLKNRDSMIKAKMAVVSNLSVWDLYSSGIVDNSHFSKEFIDERMATPVGKSFMHLHIGFKATRDELERLQAHYMYMDDWKRGVMAEDNAVLISIPSVHDESLAPPGMAVLHAYSPATENFDRWENIDYKSEEYLRLKDERSQYLWNVMEKIIPDIRQRAQVVKVGTPLTHKRFLRRHKGSYGPAIVAGEGSFPFPSTPIKNLLMTGDSCFPGIGVPATAGSGLLSAHSISIDSLKHQLTMLENLRRSTTSSL